MLNTGVYLQSLSQKGYPLKKQMNKVQPKDAKLLCLWDGDLCIQNFCQIQGWNGVTVYEKSLREWTC